ncbi:hypothetical protein KP509_07G064100 [Ceratopteris richardii]|uniref:Uncharacterized protein n=1 Tax=Ceratopteris richardii TaxID=49495 RepID=A0A8T2UFP7_CERRI|nr:hypothetical protein KP509_07G064100 [Ceratopteris richardii]
MSDSARKLHSSMKPSKPVISSSAYKSQGIVKDFGSPQKSASKAVASSSKVPSKQSSKADTDKKGKKVYELPGQKHDPPEERDPLRIFYESLYRQNPKSEMAQIWMMEHGLLSPEAAKKALERKKKIQLNQKLGIPIKSSSKGSATKTEKISLKPTVITPDRKIFISNGDSKVKRKLSMDSDSDDDKPLRPKKKLVAG